jgi:RND family efflux transporter MFP subunit
MQLVLVIGFIIGAFVLSKLIAYTYEPPGQREAEERVLYVNIAEVAPQPHAPRFTTTGVVQPPSPVQIVPQVSGRVVEVSEAIYSGGQFRADTPLFRIDPRDFRYRVRQLKAEVARARTALELAQADSEAAIAEWRQFHDKDEPVPELVARLPQLEEAKAALNSARAQLSQARLDMERSRYTLPFAGRVIESRIARGQYLQAGQAYGEVYDSGALEVRASLDEEQLRWVQQAGEPEIVIQMDFLGQTRTIEGELRRGAASLDAQTRFAPIFVGLKHPQDSLLLLPGVFTELTISGPVLEQITKLPPSALQARGVVWSVDENQRLVKHTPEVLYHGNAYVAVRGFSQPQEVVTSRISGATEGMQITVNNGATSDNSEAESDDE